MGEPSVTPAGPAPRRRGRLTASRPRLRLEDRGAGEPVLVVAGWTIPGDVVQPVAHLYLPHVRGIVYDHRGTGRSQRWHGPVSIPMLAADAARVLDDRRIAAAHVMGLSMGAAVALELAIRMPYRVKSLVLMGGSPGGPLSAAPAPGAIARLLGTLARDSVAHRRAWPAAALFAPEWRLEHGAREEELVPPFMADRPLPWAIGAQTLAMSCFDRARDLHRVKAPTLIVHGDRDAMSPLANAHLLHRGIRGSRLEIARGAGHAVALEHPEATADLLLAWVAEHAATEPPRLDDRATRRRERLTRRLALPAGALRAQSHLPEGIARRVVRRGPGRLVGR